MRTSVIDAKIQRMKESLVIVDKNTNKDDIDYIIRSYVCGEMNNGSESYGSIFKEIGRGANGKVLKYVSVNETYAIKVLFGCENDGIILEELQGNSTFLKLFFYCDGIMVTRYVNSYTLKKISKYTNIINIDDVRRKLEVAVDLTLSKKIRMLDIHSENVIVNIDTGEIIISDVGCFYKVEDDNANSYIDSHEIQYNLFERTLRLIEDNNNKIINRSKYFAYV